MVSVNNGLMLKIRPITSGSMFVVRCAKAPVSSYWLNFGSLASDMPKKLLDSKQNINKVVENNSAVTLNASGDIVIKVHAKPGSKSNRITDIGSEEVGIQISAAPVDGEANTELVKYLAKLLRVRKGDISLDKGSKSRTKTLILTAKGLLVADVLEKLEQEIENK